MVLGVPVLMLWNVHNLLQMKIIFNCFKSVSPKLIDQSRLLSPEGEVDCQSFAYHMLLPLYKVCEGFAGKVISGMVSHLISCKLIVSSVCPYYLRCKVLAAQVYDVTF